MINGKPRGRIFPNRGIRQGDPLSSFIFVLSIDYLSRILQHLEQQKQIKGITIKDLNLTHLLFSDDILVFVEDSGEYIRNLQFAIHLFEKAIDLNINLNKSTISPVNVSKERSDKIAVS